MKPSTGFSPLLWDVLKQALGDKAKLQGILDGLPKEEVLAFHRDFRRALHGLWSTLESGGHLKHDEDLSEDTLEDMFAYVVSQGRDYYDDIISHPEKLRYDIHPSEVPFLGVPRQVFLQRFGEEIDLQ